jgi:N-ethylmaleimide reductase
MTHHGTDEVEVAPLFEPGQLGSIPIKNRVVMAPMTRIRATAEGVPTDLMVEYYRQRAGVGLIITEGTYPTREGQSYPDQPGIATPEQAEGWRRVVDAVHAEGGRIVLQIQHGGRASNPHANGGLRVIAPSAVRISGTHFIGGQEFHVPEQMRTGDVEGVIRSFAAAAQRAADVGCDGVEIHAANGYLLHQFLAPSANERTDDYGGSPGARARLTVEVVAAVAGVLGAGRVGLRISPQHNIQDATEDDIDDVLLTYSSVLEQIRPLGLAYLSVLQVQPGGELVRELQRRFAGKVIVNGGFFGNPTAFGDAQGLIELPYVYAVAVGRAALANPDLVTRWSRGLEENPPRYDFFYASGPEGYTDYPTLADS